MNNKVILVFCTLLLSSFVPLLQAETYSWIDEQGTVNFTEDRDAIPKKYRKKIKRYDEMSAPPSTVAPDDSKKGGTQAPSKSPEVAGTTSLFAGKSYDQWKQELAEREAAMNELRARIEQLDGQLKKSGGPALLEERKKLVEQYRQLAGSYNNLVEDARKAGLKIEMK